MWSGPADDVTLLPFKKGDLLVLTKKQGLLTSENWTLAQNDRTGKTGLVPTACLYAIPTVVKPSAQLLVSHTFTSTQLDTEGTASTQPRGLAYQSVFTSKGVGPCPACLLDCTEAGMVFV